jgi:hypothetical protein
MKYRIFGQAVSKIHDCFGLCNVVKGGKYSLRYLYRKELSEKYEIYRRTKKSITNIEVFVDKKYRL